MTRYDPALWDDSDPLYAPNLTWGGNGNRYAYWVAARKAVKGGFLPKRVSLGKFDQPRVVTPEIALRCRELTREQERWWEGQEKPKVEPGTWDWLIARYKKDEFSGYNRVKANTRNGYDYWLDSVGAVCGKWKVAETDIEALSRVLKGKEAKKRSAHHIHNWFNTLRRVARHGLLIDARGAERVATILSNLRIPQPNARSVVATREHVEAIVAAADERGMKAFAVGVLIQFWFGLRAVDVRGHYLEGEWRDGLTWEMFTPDLRGFSKVISKTARSLPAPYDFDLTPLPEIRERLMAIRADSGPVTINPRTLKPYTTSGWTQAWGRMRERAGVPKNVWLMDTRAGAASEASKLPLTPLQLRNALGHKSVTTTDRYVRQRSDDANAVIRLRRGES